MSARTTRAAVAALAIGFATILTCRAEDSRDALALLRDSFQQQTGEELATELTRDVARAWQACEKKGIARTGDRPPAGALVFYHTPYNAAGRLAVSCGDGKVAFGGDPVALDTIPGRLGWIDGPRKVQPVDGSVAANGSTTRPKLGGTCGTGAGTDSPTGKPGANGGDPATGANGAANDPTKKPTTEDGLAGGPATSKPVQPVASNQAPVNQAPVNQAPVNQTPANQSPFSQAPSGGSPSGGSPSGGSPSGGSPSGGSPNGSNPGFSNPGSSNPGSSNPGSSNPGSSNPSNASVEPPRDPNFQPTAGSTFTAKGTGYYPANTRMEGGFKDRRGKPLQTLQDFLAQRSPFVSVAMDLNAFPYGTKLRIREFEAKYGREIEFRVVDTGGAFRGKGTTRIDICTANESASRDATVNGMLHCEVVR